MRCFVGITRSSSRRCLATGTLALSLLLAAAGGPAVARSDDGGPAGGRSPWAFLEGRAFSVRIDGGTGQTATDRLNFAAGAFWSELCRKYNFADAPYWIRTEGERVHFRVETASPTDGTMIWTGTVEGGSLRGEMQWTKPRWYWTVRTRHRISGTVDR